MYYVYIIQSLKDGSFYVGYSANPNDRLQKHNSSNRGYTASKKPWVMYHTESYSTKRAALKREKYIKSQKSSVFIIGLKDS